MHRRPIATLIVLVLAGTSPAPAQIPDSFTNLKVLPKTIERRELINTMRGFAQGLGVRCEHCHVPFRPGIDSLDFASDEKPAKETARAMMRMVADLNQKYIAEIKSDRPRHITVTCATCHHAQNLPRMLEDVIAEVLAEKGLDSATVRYRELRTQYYGRYVYDFGDIPLRELARRLMAAGKGSDAIAMLELDAEFNPRSSIVYYYMGEFQRQLGSRDKAIAGYRKSLELDPSNESAKEWLEKLGGS